MDQTAATEIVPKQGWSWGAFMLNFQFLIAVKRYQLLWWYLLALVPILNIFFLLAFSIYLGIKGHGLGTTGKQFANQAEYDGYMKATDHVGKIVFIVALIIFALAIILVIAGVSFGFLFPHMSPSTIPNSYPAGISTY